eukprot:XP_014774970.1 PREDICTED: uncharacterized protein LOC106872472 isoform X2 [Octopus bimaculoides]
MPPALSLTLLDQDANNKQQNSFQNVDEIGNFTPDKSVKSRCQKILDSNYYKYGSLCCLIILVFVCICLTQKCPPPPPLQPVATTSPLPTTPTSPPFHHSLLHLKTKGYEELESLTNLQWIKVMNQSKGDIKLLGGTFIYIPEDGIYLIECTIQLNIPKNTITFHMFLTLEGKNGTQYEYIKETLNSLTFSEHTRIQLISTKYLEVNDKIYFRMNKVKFISPDKSSSRCSITNIH